MIFLSPPIFPILHHHDDDENKGRRRTDRPIVPVVKMTQSQADAYHRSRHQAAQRSGGFIYSTSPEPLIEIIASPIMLTDGK